MTTNVTELGGTVFVLPVIGEYIGVKEDFCGGKPHVIGHRIKVQHIVVWHERMGMTPEEIVATYPTLTLGAVFAALAYYHGHRNEIDADIEADQRLIAQMKSGAAPSILKEKMSASHGKNHSLPSG